MKYLQSIIYNLFKILVIVIRFEFESFFDEQSEWNPITSRATLYTELT